MASALEANLGLLAALSSLGLGLVLGIVGMLAARRLKSKKIGWVAAGFVLLGAQGGFLARSIADDANAADPYIVPAVFGLLAMIVLYVAVYRRP